MKRISYAACLLALFAASATAACPPSKPWNTVCLQYTAPTQFTDGSPIVLAMTMHVYRGDVKIASVKHNTVQGTILLPSQPKGQQCYFLTVTVAGNTTPSAPSNTACKTVRFPGPTDGKIEAPTDGVIEPKQ